MWREGGRDLGYCSGGRMWLWEEGARESSKGNVGKGEATTVGREEPVIRGNSARI